MLDIIVITLYFLDIDTVITVFGETLFMVITAPGRSGGLPGGSGA
jgi:hypothetical protein